MSIVICQALLSKDLMHSKSAPRIGKFLEIEDFECIGPYAAVLPMHHSEEEEANFSGQLERFSVNKART